MASVCSAASHDLAQPGAASQGGQDLPVSAGSDNGLSEYFYRDLEDYETRFTCYMIHSANRIIWEHEEWRDGAGEVALPFPTTLRGLMLDSKLSIEHVLSAAELVAAHVDPIPDQPMMLLKKCIDMRHRMQEVYVDFLKRNMDASRKKIKARVKLSAIPPWYTLSYLKQMWFTLDGDAWFSAYNARNEPEGTLARQIADEETLLDNGFLTGVKFAPVVDQNMCNETRQTSAAGSELGPSDDGSESQRASKRATVVRQVQARRLEALTETPTERFIFFTDLRQLFRPELHMALICYWQQANEVQSVIRDTFERVAHGQLPLVVASLMAQVGLGILDYQEESITTVFGNETTIYTTMLATLTAYHEISLTDAFTSPSGHKFPLKDITFAETHSFLVDFIEDYKKAMAGYPSEKMRASFVDPWDPDADLGKMGETDRKRWLRTYTIKWLYDLVITYAAGLRAYLQSGSIDLDKSDCYIIQTEYEAVSKKYQRLLGLHLFAADITAFIHGGKRHPSDVICFKNVVWLQCAITAFLATRGWQFRPSTGHHFKPVIPYDPISEVEKFFSWDRPNGFGPAFADARRMFFDEVQKHAADQQQLSDISQAVCQQICPLFNLIGNPFWHPETELPVPLLVDHEGMWRYSPFLCGTALVDALTVSTGVALALLDRHTEVFAYVHLHHMLRKLRYLTEDVSVTEPLNLLLPSKFFPNGEPDAGFRIAFDKLLEEISGQPASKFMADPRRRLSQTGKVHISWEDSHIFNLPGWIADSYLPPTLYYSIVKATNLPDAVAYRDLLPNSYLAVFKRFTRLCAGSDAFSTLKDDRVEPEFAAEYKELLRGFFTPVNADKNPESLPFAWSRPDAGNLLCRVRYELMSVPAYTSYLNVPGILADIFAFFDALLPEMLQRFPGKLDVEEVGPGKMQRGTRLLATQVLLDLADSHDQDRGFLEDVARMMRKCSATSGVHYHLAGYDPGTLFGLCLASQLKEQRHTPECTML